MIDTPNNNVDYNAPETTISEAESLRRVIRMPTSKLLLLQVALEEHEELLTRPPAELTNNIRLVLSARNAEASPELEEEAKASSPARHIPPAREGSRKKQLDATVAGANAAFMAARAEEVAEKQPDFTENEKQCLAYLGKCTECPRKKQRPDCEIKDREHVKLAIEEDAARFKKLRGYDRPKARTSRNTRAAED